MNISKGKARPKTSSRQRPSAVVRANTKAAPKKSAPRTRVADSGGPLTDQYIRTLSDPFEYGGLPLGFGALIPTKIATIYYRGAVSANADGSLGVLIYPQATGMITVANGGAAVSFATAATAYNAADATAVSTNFGSGRVVSLGIKAYANLSATATPGQVGVGALSGSNYTLAQALTPNDLMSFPTTHVGKGYDGGVACGRPQDTESFEFYPQVVNGTGFTGTTELPCSIPYVTFSGVGNETTIYIEVTVNVECIEILQHSSAGIGMNDLDSVRTLASEWTGLEKMWSRVRTLLPTPGRIGYDVMSGYGQATQAVMGGGNMSYGGRLARKGRN